MTRPETIGEMIRLDTLKLSSVSDSPQLDCQILLGHALDKPRSWLFSHSTDYPDARSMNSYQALLKRRLAGEPVAYLTSSKGFWQQEFKVSAGTLIPRPETELLVETLLDSFDDRARRVLDLGTGTGAIAISLAGERPDWTVTATDISSDALDIAACNGAGLTNIRFMKSDWFQDISGSFEIIVSNPPYLRKDDPHLESLRFEPRLALTAGSGGLDCLHKIITQAGKYLTPGGTLMLEHGFDQQPAVVGMLTEAGYREIKTYQDLQALPRAVLARRPEIQNHE